MSSYTQLTAEERYHIYIMIKKDLSLREMARGMGRSHSSLSRELRRNKGGHGYRYQQAHQWAVQRHKEKPKSSKLTTMVADYIN